LQAIWLRLRGTITLRHGQLRLRADAETIGFGASGDRAVKCGDYLVIGSALTFLLLYWLLPRMTVARLQAISLITPPGAVALGWAIGGEKFSLWSLLGACFVLAGVWMIFRKAKLRELAIEEGEKSVQFPEG
jgi:hypothetical protein